MALITMSIRERAFLWFFVGSSVFGTLLSGVLVYDFDYDLYLSGAPLPKYMSFGAGSNMSLGGALYSAIGYAVGTWCFHVTFSRKQTMLLGALCCAAMFCAMITMSAPISALGGFGGSQTGDFVFVLAMFLGGLAMVPLGKRMLEKKATDARRD